MRVGDDTQGTTACSERGLDEVGGVGDEMYNVSGDVVSAASLARSQSAGVGVIDGPSWRVSWYALQCGGKGGCELERERERRGRGMDRGAVGVVATLMVVAEVEAFEG